MAVKRRHGDDEGAFNAVGKKHRPLQGLHAADRAAEDQPQAMNTEGVEEFGLGADVVADGNEGEGRARRFRRSRDRPNRARSIRNRNRAC